MRSLVLSILIALTIGQTGCVEPMNQGGNPVLTSPTRMPEKDAENSSRVDRMSFKSDALDRDMSLEIYVPPGYSAEQTYPVLYMLYGYGGDESAWFTWLGLNQVADRLINEDRIKPLIIVTPNYDQSFGVNSKPGEGVNPGGVDEGAYADYLSQDVIAYVDRHYSTISKREGRFIGGASMGGYAALYLAFTYPELFSKVGGHSAALWNFSGSDQFVTQRDWLYPSHELQKLRDPFLLAENNDVSSLQVYLDVGQSDELAKVNRMFYETLLSRDIPVEFHPTPGGHNRDYWKINLDRYLMFYAS